MSRGMTLDMLAVTPKAKEWIKTKLDEADAPNSMVLRVFDQNGSINIAAGFPQDDDVLYQDDGKVFLAVAPDASDQLAEKTLNCDQTEGADSLVIIPNLEA